MKLGLMEFASFYKYLIEVEPSQDNDAKVTANNVKFILRDKYVSAICHGNHLYLILNQR